MQDLDDNMGIIFKAISIDCTVSSANVDEVASNWDRRLRQSGNPRESLDLAFNTWPEEDFLDFNTWPEEDTLLLKTLSIKETTLQNWFNFQDTFISLSKLTTKQLCTVEVDASNLEVTWGYHWCRGERRWKIEGADVRRVVTAFLLLFFQSQGVLQVFLHLSWPLGSPPIPHSSLEMPPAPTRWIRLHDGFEQPDCVLLMTPPLPVDVVKGEVREGGGGRVRRVGAGPGFEDECRHEKSRPAHGRRLTDSSYAGVPENAATVVCFATEPAPTCTEASFTFPRGPFQCQHTRATSNTCTSELSFRYTF